MTTVSLPRQSPYHGRKLRLSGQCFIVAGMFLMIMLMFSPFFLESSADYNLSTRDSDAGFQTPPAPQRDSVRLRQSPKQTITKVAGLDYSHIAEEYPDWTVSAEDGLDDIFNYGTEALTGSHVYRDGPACEARTGLPCMIHFPWVDLKNLVPHDEALDVNPMDQFFKPRAETKKTKDTTMVFPEPKHVNHLVKQPPSFMSDQHALLTRGGCKFRASGVKSNQDRAVLVSPFFHDADGSHDFVMGIFDGHGNPGHVVSNFAALEMPRVLSHWLEKHGSSSEESVKQALTDTFLEIDRSLPIVANGGSTASVILRLGANIYVSNVGDSQSFLATYNMATDSVEIVYKNGLHKPHLPEERARIEAKGGQVMMPQSEADSSRVLVPLGIDGELFALAMSRSIGDREAKLAGVIADPTVDVLHLDDIATPDLQVFAVTASDGLFDHVGPPEVALHLARSLYRRDTPPPLQACEQLIMKSSELWIANYLPYRDDITVAVTKVVM